MTHKPHIIITQYPYECEEDSIPNVSLQHVMYEKDVGLSQMLEFFECFLKASGYSFSGSLVIDDPDTEWPIDQIRPLH